MTTLEIIKKLPGEEQALLIADEWFSDIAVVVAEKGNVKAEMDQRQAVIKSKAGKWGAAVVVLQVVADDESPEIAFGPMRLHLAFQVVELVEQNRGPLGTGKTALQIARRIIQVMKPQALVGLCTDLICDKPAIEPVTIAKTDLGANVVAYQVNFVTFEWSDEVLSQVSMPIIAAAGGPAPVATMTCATAYADIWYTTDDSPPVPTSCDTLSTALLYRGPIALAEGKLTFRARGFLAGSIGSITNREVVETIAV